MRTPRVLTATLLATVMILTPSLPAAAQAPAAVQAPGAAVAATVAANEGTYHPLPPIRIVDTRSGLGWGGALAEGMTVYVRMTGVGGVPANGVSAVALNVTATEATTASYLTLFPSGVDRPNASSLNFRPYVNRANAVTVPVGENGMVNIYNFAGSVQVVADVVGYYTGADAPAGIGQGGDYYLTTPFRLTDTRDDADGPLPGGWSLSQAVNFGAAYNPRVRALAVNVTAVNPRTAGYLTTWNASDDLPSTSTVNFTAGSTVPNFAVIPTAGCTYSPSCAGMMMIGVYNGSDGPVDVLVDVVGVFDDGVEGDGMRFRPLTPTRIADTRFGHGAPGALGQADTVTMTAPAGVVSTGTHALAMNVTAVDPNANTFLTLWSADLDQPTVSNLNPGPGEIIANAAITEIDLNHGFKVYNNAGSVHLVIDVSGRFEAYTLTPGTAARAANPAPFHSTGAVQPALRQRR